MLIVLDVADTPYEIGIECRQIVHRSVLRIPKQGQVRYVFVLQSMLVLHARVIVIKIYKAVCYDN